MKAEVDSSSRGQKGFIFREEKRKVAWGHAVGPKTCDPLGQVRNWVFIAIFLALGQRCLSGANRSFLGRRSVSLVNYHLLGPPALCPSKEKKEPQQGKWWAHARWHRSIDFFV
jgi:hypothetical protein